MSECTVTTETGLCVRADGEILNDGNKTKRSNPRPRLFVLKRPKELGNSEAFEILHEDRVNAFMKRCEDENWSIDTCLSSKAYKSSIGVTELDKRTSSGIYLRDDHCDWGSSGMNEFTNEFNSN